ncbi:MAG: hypothetical protein AAFZ38_08285 [Myxococcota bacterium]
MKGTDVNEFACSSDRDAINTLRLILAVLWTRDEALAFCGQRGRRVSLPQPAFTMAAAFARSHPVAFAVCKTSLRQRLSSAETRTRWETLRRSLASALELPEKLSTTWETIEAFRESGNAHEAAAVCA